MRIIHVQNQLLKIGIATYVPTNKDRGYYGGTIVGVDNIVLETRWCGEERGEFYVGYDRQENIIAMLPAVNCFVRYAREVEK